MPRVSGLGWAELDWTSPPLRQETDAVNTLLEREERRVTAAGDKLVEGERQGADMICSRPHHILKNRLNSSSDVSRSPAVKDRAHCVSQLKPYVERVYECESLKSCVRMWNVECGMWNVECEQTRPLARGAWRGVRLASNTWWRSWCERAGERFSSIRATMTPPS